MVTDDLTANEADILIKDTKEYFTICLQNKYHKPVAHLIERLSELQSILNEHHRTIFETEDIDKYFQSVIEDWDIERFDLYLARINQAKPSNLRSRGLHNYILQQYKLLKMLGV